MGNKPFRPLNCPFCGDYSGVCRVLQGLHDGSAGIVSIPVPLGVAQVHRMAYVRKFCNFVSGVVAYTMSWKELEPSRVLGIGLGFMTR